MVMNVWEKYAVCKMDVLTTSLVTTTALDVVRVYEARLIAEDLAMVDPLHAIHPLLCAAYHDYNLPAPSEHDYLNPDANVALLLESEHYFLFLTTYRLLRAPLSVLDGSLSS
ncbi:hypothetical protein AMAG_15950 [Allomyces macrogynus ATCC 38327]|uniref:Uncharacterized protein n=1 Tax=Allomyces macrogynus (strain ATCC 38327) TaxID=578462 RepID=A0A0L0TBU0_ALLM3|nr:hypothetical protein AMAG_15950 [Allomyces macrogynus ATCC 38327]|eukprot:KNE72009.1 hypothetical protein AMAG_15950 [Allomyces macrogynus ATCC 38327]